MEERYKRVGDASVSMAELVLPNDTNSLGNLLGGRMMHWIDLAGAMAATRYASCVVATVKVESLTFKHPIKMGNMVTLHARVTKVGNTSITVEVDVTSEDMINGGCLHTNNAVIVFVALDADGQPTRVPRPIWKYE